MSDTLTADASGRDAVAARLAEYGVNLDPNINYRIEKMFPKLTGWGAKGGIQRKGKVIARIEPRLSEILSDGEEVLYVAKGVQYSFAEHYFMGIWATVMNQTVFVLTNARLLMIRTNTKGKPKETFWMIYYSEIETFKSSWTMLDLKLADGKKIRFSGFPKLDRATMPAIFEEALDRYRELGFEPDTTQSLENLCGYCYHRVPKDEYECPNCEAEFWKPSAVALRSLLFPSWGDIVMKHYAFAVAEFLGYLVTWGIIFLLAFGENGSPIVGLIAAALILPVTHGIDAGLTYFIAKKGLHPRRPPVDQPSLENNREER